MLTSLRSLPLAITISRRLVCGVASGHCPGGPEQSVAAMGVVVPAIGEPGHDGELAEISGQAS
ncbi:MAG TPA: hypothetical protein VF940_34130 [Streptosporangiaceae bacterium]